MGKALWRARRICNTAIAGKGRVGRVEISRKFSIKIEKLFLFLRRSRHVGFRMLINLCEK
jgi:hypothetical protein